MTDCGEYQQAEEEEQQYLIQDVVAPLAGGDLDQPVQTLGGLLDENVPASGVVPLAAQTHHLHSSGVQV